MAFVFFEGRKKKRRSEQRRVTRYVVFSKTWRGTVMRAHEATAVLGVLAAVSAGSTDAMVRTADVGSGLTSFGQGSVP